MTMETCGAIVRGAQGRTPPYRVNTWGLRNTEANREDGKEMVKQQLKKCPPPPPEGPRNHEGHAGLS